MVQSGTPFVISAQPLFWYVSFALWLSALLKPPKRRPIKKTRQLPKRVGAFMALARQYQALPSDSRAAQESFSEAFSSVVVADNPSPESDSLTKLVDLLGADTVELRRVCDEVRAHPGLEALIIQLSSSLSFSAGSAPATIEEAAIQLGVDRLRVIFRAWSSLIGATVNQARMRNADQWTPETLYLTTFLHDLGFDAQSSGPKNQSPAHISNREIERRAELADVLVRDFLSLIPHLDPSLLKRDSSLVPENVEGADRKGEE